MTATPPPPFVVALRLGLATVTGAALFGALSPWLFWPGDLFAPFRLQYAGLFLIAVVAAASLRLRLTALMAALLFMWQALSLIPLVVDPGRGEPSGEELRLLHFNILVDNRNHGGVTSWVASQDADVIVLQETSPRWAAVLEEALTGDDADWVLVDTDTVQPGTYGMMMFTRRGLDVVHVEPGGVPGFPAIATTIRVDDEDLLIYGLHARTPTSPGEVRIANRQVDLAALTANDHDGPAVIVGDLNATRWSPVYRRLTDQVELRNSADGAGLSGTWPDRLWFTGRIGIDHVLVSPGVCTFNHSRGPASGSDHLPVTVALTVSGCP